MAKPLAYHALKRTLLCHDRRFAFRPGKGSEIVLSHPDSRRTCCLPHHGDGHTISVPVLRRIERDFRLPPGFFEPRHRRKAPAVL